MMRLMRNTFHPVSRENNDGGTFQFGGHGKEILEVSQKRVTSARIGNSFPHPSRGVKDNAQGPFFGVSFAEVVVGPILELVHQFDRVVTRLGHLLQSLVERQWLVNRP